MLSPSLTLAASDYFQTALLREVLSRDSYHVLHFDLRIAGFADLSSLYMSLSQQMEQYFQDISENMEGYEEFEKEAWSFKVGLFAILACIHYLIFHSTIALRLNDGYLKQLGPAYVMSRRVISRGSWNYSRSV